MSDHQGDSNQQNFDESELQEIMNEIEDLEREVASGDLKETSEDSEIKADAEKKNLQSEIDRDIEGAHQSMGENTGPVEEPSPEPSEDIASEESPEEKRSQMEVVPEQEHPSSDDEEPAIDFDEEELRALEEDDEAPVDTDASVSSFKKPRGAEPGQRAESSPVHFQAHGDMGVDLSFQVGEENAYLSIEPGPSGKQGLRVQMSGVELFLDAEEGCRVELEGGARFTFPVSMQKGHQKAS